MKNNFLRFAIITLALGLGFGYVLAAWQGPTSGPPTTSGPNVYNAPEPINVSISDQQKTGSLVIEKNLTVATNLFAIGRLGVGAGVTTGFTDTSAVLDVNGQIRIRGTGSFPPGVNKILTAVNNTGLSQWQDPPVGITQLDEGLGIDLADYSGLGGAINWGVISITSDGVIAINPAITQKRISGDCGVNRAIRRVDIDGLLTGAANCNSVVTTIQANSASGLTLSAGAGVSTNAESGPITLNVNAGPGIIINSSNQVTMNVLATAGDGLQISGSPATVKFETNCANGQTWKYDTSSSPALWVCSSLPPAPNTQPGGSVMYLKTKPAGTLAACPSVAGCSSGTGWCEALYGVGVSPNQYTSDEAVSSSAYNKVRVCYRTDVSCQVINISSKNSPPPGCPAGWTSAQISNEHSPGGLSTNYTNTCYICN